MKFKTHILKKSYKLNHTKKIKEALKEDIPNKDITSSLLISSNSQKTAKIIAKENGILCGIDIVKNCFKYMDKKTKLNIYKKDGDLIKKGDLILFAKGKTKSILKAERTALNFLQHLTGIATYTNTMATIAAKYNVKILDTRKTIPGLRYLAKYAVTVGGGCTHRLHLSDEVLIKENHITENNGIENTLKKLKKRYKKNFEIEVENLDEFKIALKYKASYILLDNFSLKDLKKAVKINQKRSILEASGGINLKNLKKIAKTGVDYISTGAITHSTPFTDFSLILL